LIDALQRCALDIAVSCLFTAATVAVSALRDGCLSSRLNSTWLGVKLMAPPELARTPTVATPAGSTFETILGM
jgi:hypothetical protein